MCSELIYTQAAVLEQTCQLQGLFILGLLDLYIVARSIVC